VAAEATYLTAAEDICWRTAVAACLRNEMTQTRSEASASCLISAEGALIQNNLGLF
jgi:hypothetical protein